jgi:hypothetical protein
MTLHSEQDAIKQAFKEGGLRDTFYGGWGQHLTGIDFRLLLQEPETWQALGKARGWTDSHIRRCALSHEGVEQFKYMRRSEEITTGRIVGESRNKECWTVLWDGRRSTGSYAKSFILELSGSWKSHALRYFEARLSNGDLNAFWQSLP